MTTNGKTYSINGTEIWCEERGEGLPLLLVHGFPLDHTMWDGILPFLPPVRAIAPDLRGFGRSRAADEKVTMGQFADDLAGLLDAMRISEPIVFAGLSMGGYIAFQFWRKYADRLRGLMLCDTRAAADTPDVAAVRGVMAERVLREGPAPLVETMLPRLFAEATRQNRPELVEGIRRVMMATDPHAIAAGTRGMAERLDMTDALSRIHCPALVVVGVEDVMSTPVEMRCIAQAIPDSRYAEIPAAGHLSPIENPKAVAAAMGRFLGDVM